MVRYFSVDEEFGGLNHRECALLSIGMIEIVEDNGVFKPDYNRQFYIELKPDGWCEPEAMAINKLNVEYLEEYGVSKKNAIQEINKYLRKEEDDQLVFVAYCGVLDKIFLDQLYQDKGHDFSPFNYEIIEISSLAIGKLGFGWGFSEKDLLEKLEISDIGGQKHNALQDAILQAKQFCGIMNYKK